MNIKRREKQVAEEKKNINCDPFFFCFFPESTVYLRVSTVVCVCAQTSWVVMATQEQRNHRKARHRAIKIDCCQI